MNLKQFEEETRKFPFCPTPQSEDAHFAIRKPLMEMFGLKPEKSKLEKKHDKWEWTKNGYRSKDMIRINKSAP